uniref:Retrovirus-related Pol polyprotein from transposon TNT 1-94 n=1 Tax=Nicotiana tabacum TaxID=4097 RepID=A0A1S4B0D7_TOBAC|nr:PREDICTED: uncharacterized protein LOC107803184 [Nicotiana tabacum]
MAFSENSIENENNGNNMSIGAVPSSISLDHNHPLYLHASDGPGSMSVGLILTSMDNYVFWGRAMKVALLGKNKLYLVDGSTSKEDFGPSLGISAYFTKLKDLWAEYDLILPSPPSVTEYIEQLEYQELLQFLMGLNDSFEQARSQLLLMPTLPSIDKAYTMVVQEESMKLITGGSYGHNDPTALFTAHSRPKRNYSLECDFCHLKGHTRNKSYKLMKCEYCNKTWHLKENFYKIIGYPYDFKQKKKANAVMIDAAGQQGTTVLPRASANIEGKCFCGNIALCKNLELFKWIVDIGVTNHMTGDKNLLKNKTSIANSGQVQLPTGDSVPISHMGESFKFNLKSVSKVTEDLKCSVTFFPKCCVFQDLLFGRVKEIGRKEEGLYILSMALGKIINRAFSATSREGIEIWHKRTGHVPVQALRKIPSIQHYSDRFDNDSLSKCEIYPLARQTRFGKQIKVFRLDNGSEFFTMHVATYFKCMGLSIKAHVPILPKRMELCKGETDIYWKLLEQSDFKGIYRIPSSVLAHKSPYELLLGKPPSLTYLKVIGCLCFAINLIGHDKFAPRAARLALLGYAAHLKGYTLMDMENRKAEDSLESLFLDITPVPRQDLDEEPNTTVSSVDATNVPCSSNIAPTAPNITCSPNVTPALVDELKISYPIEHNNVESPRDSSILLNSKGTRKSTRVSNPSYGLRIMSEMTTEVLQAAAVKDKRWIEEIQAEIKALEDNKTWELVSLPQLQKAIGCKWVYKIKYKALGEVERFKALLVAKGYIQRECLDYQETFSPVVKIVTVRSVLSIAASRQWSIHQMDVYNAFLQEDLSDEMYMEILQGFNGLKYKFKVCKLLKSFYGLKQASRQWNLKQISALLDAGF